MQIKEMFKYSLPSMLAAYNKNKHLINAHITGQKIEGQDSSVNTILGLSLTLFFVLFLISLALFIVGLILLIKNWHKLPTWAQVLGIVFLLFPNGALFTIIIVLVAKGQ